ncbi:hypothetical protein BFL43_09400 [Williamsia sp. 1135]|nr:hypothetical protein BFL43_09400 [Williamsia sp. 1135]
MPTAGAYVGVGEQPALVIAAFTRQLGLALVGNFGFTRVVDGSRTILEVAVVVEDAGEQGDGFVGVVGDPVAVAGQGVVAQELVEVAAGPVVGGWLG